MAVRYRLPTLCAVAVRASFRAKMVVGLMLQGCVWILRGSREAAGRLNANKLKVSKGLTFSLPATRICVGKD